MPQITIAELTLINEREACSESFSSAHATIGSLACEKARITITLPKPMTSHSKAERRFGKQDFRYLVEEGVARTGLQYDACHEYHGHQTANSGDEGVVAPDMSPSAVAEPPRMPEILIRSASRQRIHQTPKNDHAPRRPRSKDFGAMRACRLI
jgi:hypothetical protein